MLSKVYRQEAFADYSLVLIPEDTQEPLNNGQSSYPALCEVVPVHALLLADKSEVLRIKFTTAVGRPDAPSSRPAGAVEVSRFRCCSTCGAQQGRGKASRPHIYVQVGMCN